MFKTGLTFLFISLALLSKAQTADTLLKNKHFDAITANGFVQEIFASGDSLFITFTKENIFKGKDSYYVINVVPRGEYTLAIVKMSPLSLNLVTPKGKQSVNVSLYGAFVFRFQKGDIHLLVLHDGRLWLTAREAEDTYAAIRLSGEYFNMWYPSDRFARFVNYPSLLDADSLMVEKVALDWIKKITEHRAKKLNTYNTDRFGADYGRDNLTKVLVNNHLSPLGSSGDFNKKLEQYHLKLMPEIRTRPTDSISRRPKVLHGTSISD